jgi:hypothetical protein
MLFLVLTLGCLWASRAAAAQPVEKALRRGVVLPAALPSSEEPNLVMFRWALHALGSVEGQTVGF